MLGYILNFSRILIYHETNLEQGNFAGWVCREQGLGMVFHLHPYELNEDFFSISISVMINRRIPHGNIRDQVPLSFLFKPHSDF